MNLPHWATGRNPVPFAIHRLLPTRGRNLRLLAHTRRLLLLVLPLGVLSGWILAWAVRGSQLLGEFLVHHLAPGHLILALPLVGLFLATNLLDRTGVGEVSLAEDIHMGHADPYVAYPFRASLIKAAACAATVGLGGSSGLEGPGKWLGAALGLQLHRGAAALSVRFRPLRRFLTSARTMVASGAAGALAAVFRAPLSGALFAAEHEGHLRTEHLIGPLVAAAGGYLAFAALLGTAPLLQMTRPYGLRWTEILYALPLGLACGLIASGFSALQAWLRRLLAPVPLRWRGVLGALGLGVLLLPGHLRFQDLPITLGGGVELINHLLASPPDLRVALLFLGLKLMATALTLACGGVGGTWLPCAAMGASLGAAFDAWLLPGYGGLMTLLGATAFTGAFHGTLLVPVVFLAETTAQASLVVPALVATTVAYLVAQEWD
jgi:CIC family chloride channel protein